MSRERLLSFDVVFDGCSRVLRWKKAQDAGILMTASKSNFSRFYVFRQSCAMILAAFGAKRVPRLLLRTTFPANAAPAERVADLLMRSIILSIVGDTDEAQQAVYQLMAVHREQARYPDDVPRSSDEQIAMALEFLHQRNPRRRKKRRDAWEEMLCHDIPLMEHSPWTSTEPLEHPALRRMQVHGWNPHRVAVLLRQAHEPNVWNNHATADELTLLLLSGYVRLHRLVHRFEADMASEAEVLTRMGAMGAEAMGTNRSPRRRPRIPREEGATLSNAELIAATCRLMRDIEVLFEHVDELSAEEAAEVDQRFFTLMRVLAARRLAARKKR
jgi:hypothetical protein